MGYMRITLLDEQADTITVDNIKQSLEREYQEDSEEPIVMHMKEVLKYFMVMTEYEDYIFDLESKATQRS